MQEAKLAKEKMHGRLACGRPLVVRISSEHQNTDESSSPQGSSRTSGQIKKPAFLASSHTKTNKNAKIAAIKNKLRALEEETSGGVAKRSKTG
ncbi:hypothetical protein LINPERHAP1_LOCUS5680 [Linum perenne]